MSSAEPQLTQQFQQPPPPQAQESGKKRKDKYAELPPQAQPQSQQQQQQQFQGERRAGPDFALYAPLVYGPLLPLIRIAFKNNTLWRNRLFFSGLTMATVHGFYVILTRWG